MHVETGVELAKLTKNITAILPIARLIFYESKNQFIVTASTWGRDSLRYAHEHGNAIDVAVPMVNRTAVLYRLKDALGINYCVLDMKTHFHIGFDPLGDKPSPAPWSAGPLSQGKPRVEASNVK